MTVRTLLIDNYDSYTYNLFQLIAEVNGVEPVVVTNDAVDEARLDLSDFDNVVISPGPGHPANPRDFGISATVIARTRIPLLGVCLGHQGIAVGEGGEVSAAPAARHGHLTRVTHAGGDLFRGLPGQFMAVRYHSLCVQKPLPSTLALTAWAEDGVIMGIRHRTRPLWGVQFHPESVATEFGGQLLANFRDLTSAHLRACRPRITVPAAAPTAAGSRREARAEPTGPVPGEDAGGASRLRGAAETSGSHHLQVRELDMAVDTEVAFTALFSTSKRAFWLDSARAEPGLARFSYLGDASGPLAEFVTYRVGQGHVEVSVPGQQPRRFAGSIFDYLAARLPRRVIGPPLPFDFACGYVGYFGYELKADCGSPNRHRAPMADACWLFTDRMLAVDHEAGRSYLLALDDGSPAGGRAAGAWLDKTASLLCTLPPPTSLPACVNCSREKATRSA
jgi:para-aminobenzoate synthetase